MCTKNIFFTLCLLLLSFTVHAKQSSLNDELVVSSAYGDLKKIKYLLKIGADIDGKHSANKFTALQIAVGQGNYKITKYLIEHKADLSIKGPEGANAISLALLKDEKKIFDLLLKNGAKLQKTDAGLTPLMLAANTKHLDIIKKLIALGQNTNESQADGWTALMHASYNSNIPVIDLLIKNGANIQSKNKDGENAKDIAKSKGNNTVAEFFKNNNL